MSFKVDLIVYLLFFAAIIFSFYAQIKVNSTFNKYSAYSSGSRRTAAEVARMILTTHGVNDVTIERVSGNLTDHYDPRAKVLRLSDSVYSSNSVAAIGVAAHEAGHAIQHAEGYAPIKIRSALVPVTNFSSRISWVVILLGFIMTAIAEASSYGYYILLAGIALFSVTAVFQLVTLPVEFDASSRAIADIENSGWYSEEEVSHARKVLSAAAMTYVAALFVTIMQILRLLLAANRRRD